MVSDIRFALRNQRKRTKIHKENLIIVLLIYLFPSLFIDTLTVKKWEPGMYSTILSGVLIQQNKYIHTYVRFHFHIFFILYPLSWHIFAFYIFGLNNRSWTHLSSYFDYCIIFLSWLKTNYSAITPLIILNILYW